MSSDQPAFSLDVDVGRPTGVLRCCSAAVLLSRAQARALPRISCMGPRPPPAELAMPAIAAVFGTAAARPLPEGNRCSVRAWAFSTFCQRQQMPECLRVPACLRARGRCSSLCSPCLRQLVVLKPAASPVLSSGPGVVCAGGEGLLDK